MAATTAEKELLDLEKQYWRALQENDLDAVVRLTDFPCIISGTQGARRTTTVAKTELFVLISLP